MIYHEGLINGFKQISVLTTCLVLSLYTHGAYTCDMVELNVTNFAFAFSRNDSLPTNECG